MDFNDYLIEALASDPNFIKWVKNPDEQTEQYWKQWMLDNPGKYEIIQAARELVKAIEFQVHGDTEASVHATWKKILATNEAMRERAKSKRAYLPRVRRTSFYWVRMAAVFAGMLVVFSAVLYFMRGDSNSLRIYHTAFGETKEISLPDGSQVTLNANSTLRLGDNWLADREVWLEGEAFFSVRKKSNSEASKQFKFTVHTQTVHVDVLGTEFTISEYKKNTTVVLNSGKIQLNVPHENKMIIMKPGDLVQVNSGSRQLIKREVDPEIYSAWKNKEWILDDFTLEQVAQRIEGTYGLKVIVRNHSVGEVKVTGVVPTDDIDTLLNALETVFERRFTREGDTIFIE